MKRFFVPLIIIISLTGCLKKKIEITAEYVINENWSKRVNSIKINKLKVKEDSTINPFSNLTHIDLLGKLEDDTTFIFVGNVKYNGENYSTRKVFFNKKNNFLWWTTKGDTQTDTIGTLQKNTWYKFSNLLTYPYYLYIYVDSTSQVHRFDVNQSNY
ncbi:hypothetical protein [Chitinophaga sp. YIM B06452]|uniref:hypothetical protein n=1 Tax=Chitinophaga sp. YIM B06452 TaxID=3082158 RepID=UPI0031FEC309